MTKQEAIDFLSNTKVYVKDKSEEIQKKLFEIGFAWTDAPIQNVLNTDRPFIFIYDNMQLTHSCDVKWFNSHPHKEITVEEILNITFKPKYRPFTSPVECWAEMHNHSPFGWVKKRHTYGEYTQLVHISTACDFEDGFNKITFADGEPFGVKEE